MESPVLVDDTAANPWLAADSIRRLCVSLILTEQADLLAKGFLSRDAMAPLQDPHLSRSQRDVLRIDEDGLGFDSLARLNLVFRFNRFFHLSETGIEDYLLIHRSLGEWVGLVDQHLRLMADNARFTFDTSGSAGPVKHITHRAADLFAEMQSQCLRPLAHVPQGMRIISLVPPHHIYGFLFSCILPAVLRCDVLDLHMAGPTAVFRLAQPADLIIGTPLNWRMLHGSYRILPPGVFGVTSAGPSNEVTWAVRQVNGLAGLTEIYGSTETGGIGARSEPSAPFQLLPHLTRDGEGVIDPIRGQEPLVLQDRIEWLDTRCFQVLGRLDDVVKVGGVNVSPTHVRNVLCTCDGVADAAVRLGGDRLNAFIVPKAGVDLTGLEVRMRAHIAANLPAPARPVALTFGSDLPVNAMGKSCNWDTAPGAR